MNVLISCPAAGVFLPYVHGVLKSYCRRDPEIRERFHWLDPIWYSDTPDRLLSSYEELAIDVLGLSCYLWSNSFNQDLARAVKRKNPNCLVVAGGPDIPHDDPDLFRRYPHLDVVVLQDGEIPFSRILSRLAQGGGGFFPHPRSPAAYRDPAGS